MTSLLLSLSDIQKFFRSASLGERPHVPNKLSQTASFLSSGVRCEIQSSSYGKRVSKTVLLVSMHSTANCMKCENGRREDEQDDQREPEC
jgi:hypothetical protein